MFKLSTAVARLAAASVAPALASRPSVPELAFAARCASSYAGFTPSAGVTLAGDGMGSRAAFLRLHPEAAQIRPAVPSAAEMVLEARAARPFAAGHGLLNADPAKALAYAARMLEMYAPGPVDEYLPAPELEIVPLAAQAKEWKFADHGARREPAFEIRRRF